MPVSLPPLDSGWSLTTPWLLTALVLYLAVMALGILGYTPTLRRQVQLVESGGAETPEYEALRRLSTLQGIVLAVLVVAITFLMVVKPPLWSAS